MASGTATPAESAAPPTADASTHLHVPDPSEQPTDGASAIDVREFDDSFETAFQLATLRGPLCAEPVSGVAFSLEAIEVHSEVASLEAGTLSSPRF